MPDIIDPSVETLSTEELQRYPFFADIPSKPLQDQLEWNPNAVVRRRFEAGDYICRQGEYGSTAFYVVEGAVEIFLASPVARAASRKRENERSGLLGLVRRFSTQLVSIKEDDEQGERQASAIHVDAPVDLDFDSPVGELGAGDLFGEMTCMSFYPRSATVRAIQDCEILEMQRNVLELLKKRSKTFREQLDRNYRQRALNSHLRSVPELADLPDHFLDYLRERVELLSFSPGEVICAQGDVADGFYLIRLGFVKVSQTHPGGELVINYLSRGQYFGEIALFARGRRIATCTALDHVEVVRIRTDEFESLVEQFPQIKERLEREADRRLEENRRRMQTVPEVPLDDFLEQGLMNAQNVLLLDLEKCTRCDDCVRACADAHDGVTRLVREGLRYDKYLVATSCRQCTDPLCMIGCPVGSIRRRETLEIIIEDWCIGCGLCAKQCPYGNINIHSFQTQQKAVVRKAVACDLCSTLSEPSCVYACPHQAAMRVNPRRFFAGETAART